MTPLGTGREIWLLHRVAKALQRRTRRTSDVVARLGGDEFGLLLVEVDPPEAVEVGRKLISVLAITHHGRAVTASIGVAPFAPGGQVGVDDLIAAATLALYEAKGGRAKPVRGAWRRFDPSIEPG